MACKESVFHASCPFHSVLFWFWSKSTLRKAWVPQYPPSVVNTSPLAPECGHWEARWPALKQACWVHPPQLLGPAVPARHAASPVPGTTSALEERSELRACAGLSVFAWDPQLASRAKEDTSL